jgi:hypothetical protein
MADGSDAENFSTPWESGVEKGYYLIRQTEQIEVTVGEELITVEVQVSLSTLVNRNQCQRLKIAAINWADATGWTVTQHLIGTLYMPNNVHFGGELQYEDPDPSPAVDWPLNTAENESWSDPWTGYTKNFNSGGPSTTENIPV